MIGFKNYYDYDYYRWMFNMILKDGTINPEPYLNHDSQYNY